MLILISFLSHSTCLDASQVLLLRPICIAQYQYHLPLREGLSPDLTEAPLRPGGFLGEAEVDIQFGGPLGSTVYSGSSLTVAFISKMKKKLTVCDAINECEPLPLVFDEVELM
jgi:hypothetical protein